MIDRFILAVGVARTRTAATVVSRLCWAAVIILGCPGWSPPHLLGALACVAVTGSAASSRCDRLCRRVYLQLLRDERRRSGGC